MLIAVLGSSTGWRLAEMKRAAGERHQVISASFAELGACVSSSVAPADSSQTITAGQAPLSECGAVLVGSMSAGSLEQVVLRMDALAQLQALGVRVINPAKAVEAAVDKYLATSRLAAAGLLTPKTFACQTAGAALEAFRELGGRAVLKPLFGGEGRGLSLLEDEAVAARGFGMLERLGAVIYLQEFIEHEGFDFRLLVIGKRVLGMRRVNPHDWRTNVSRGARAEPLEVTDELAAIALKAAEAVGAPLAGVDLLPGRDGRLYAIEVNAAPGWRALAGVTGVDVAGEVLRLLCGEGAS